MNKRLGIIKRVVSFYCRSGTIYNNHSPFFYNFYKNIIKASGPSLVFQKLEGYRKKWLNSDDVITITDLGAKSHISNQSTRSVKSIAKHSLSSKHEAGMLYNLCRWKKVETVLELGTSLGLATAYMSYAVEKGKIYTIEGDPAIYGLSNSFFKECNLKNIESLCGDIAIRGPEVISQVESLDLVFIDGNHQYQATMNYFDMVAPKLHSNSCVVIDDVFWSEGMETAWAQIKSHPKVTSSILLYDFGVLFFNRIAENGPHLEIVPSWLKPWTWIKMI